MKNQVWIIVLLVAVSNAWGQPGTSLVIRPGFTYTLLKHQVSFIVDSTNRLSIRNLDVHPDRKPYQHNTIVFGGYNPPMWLLFDIVCEKLTVSSYILDVSYIGLDGAEVFIKNNMGVILKLPTVQRRDYLEDRPFPDNKLLFNFSLEPKQKYTIYVKTPRTYERHLISLHLWDRQKFIGSTIFQKSIFFSLIGGLLLAVLISIILFLFLNEAIFWQYGLYVLSLCLIILVMSGYVDPYLLSIPFLKFDSTAALMIFFSISIHVVLSNNYLSVKCFSPYWMEIIGKIISLCCLLFVIPFFLPFLSIHRVLISACYQLLIIAELFIFVNILLGLRKKHIPSIIYFVRFLPFVICLPLLLTTQIQLLDYIYQSVEILLIAAFLEVLFLGVGIGFSYYETRKAKTELAIQLNQTQAQVIQTQESERQRIAADLHDDLGGTLATIRRRVADLRQKFQNPQSRTDFDELEPLIQKSSDDLRRISHNLMPPEFARIGLPNSLQQLVQAIPKEPTRFEFLKSGTERKLALSTELSAYRIVSELVQNILKHAQAKRATVQLLYYEDHLTVMVEDNGVGNKNDKPDGSDPGIGLKNSILRADYMGAKLWREISPAGTLVILEIPYLPASYEPVAPGQGLTD